MLEQIFKTLIIMTFVALGVTGLIQLGMWLEGLVQYPLYVLAGLVSVIAITEWTAVIMKLVRERK